MARPDLREEEMVEALKKVNLWEFLKGEGGLQARLLEQGGNFSGGPAAAAVHGQGAASEFAHLYSG